MSAYRRKQDAILPRARAALMLLIAIMLLPPVVVTLWAAPSLRAQAQDFVFYGVYDRIVDTGGNGFTVAHADGQAILAMRRQTGPMAHTGPHLILIDIVVDPSPQE